MRILVAFLDAWKQIRWEATNVLNAFSTAAAPVLAAIGLIATDVHCASAGSVFWTTGSQSLWRADSDGSNREVLLDDQFGLATGLAIAQRDNQLYWVESLPVAKIRRSSLDGSNIEDLIVLADNPAGIDLDLTSNKMYWTERFSNRIRRANLDGTNIETVVENAIESRGLRLDLVNGHIYWAELGTNRLRRANLDGSESVDIISVGMSRPWDLEIDIANRTLYWSQLGPNTANDMGAIFRTDFTGAAPEILADELRQPSSIDLDVIHGHLWFAHGLNYTIDRIDLADGNIETVVASVGIPQYVVVETIPEPSAIALLMFGAIVSTIACRCRTAQKRRQPPNLARSSKTARCRSDFARRAHCVTSSHDRAAAPLSRIHPATSLCPPRCSAATFAAALENGASGPAASELDPRQNYFRPQLPLS